MRKVLAISLIFIYVALFGGFKLSMHFCGDELTEYSIYSTTSEENNCCSSHSGCSKHVETKKMSCCEDKSIYLYSDVNTTFDSYKIPTAAPALNTENITYTTVANYKAPLAYQANAPPTKQGRAIYQLTSSYTFYG